MLCSVPEAVVIIKDSDEIIVTHFDKIDKQTKADLGALLLQGKALPIEVYDTNKCL